MSIHNAIQQHDENDRHGFPFRLHWTSQELADAVPLRLHEMFGFQAGRDGAQPRSANGPAHATSRARRDRGYLLATALPYFRIH